MFGITNKNTNFFAVNISFDNDGFAEFDVYHDDKFYERIKTRLFRRYNSWSFTI